MSPKRLQTITVIGMADPDPRVVVPVRLRASNLERLDQIAAEHDWSRSDAMRHLFRLGLAAYDNGRRPVAADEARPFRPVPKPGKR